jgi:L-ascorbate metabolism protein UlaG (beta-lactamase superfamily)/enamine deaminase RidA (YjgF/YER057c/UK114 family)
MNEFKHSLARNAVCNFPGFHRKNSVAALSFFFVFLLVLCSPWGAMAQSDQTYDPEARLAALDIKLPAPPSPVANYVNGVRTGNLIFLAGKGPKRSDGFELRGKLGKDLTIKQGYAGARQTAINQLAVLKAMLGNLNRVKRVVKVLGMVNSDPSFVEQPAVINGFSDLIVEVFGDRGRHARAAIGMASLPRGQAVEIEMIVEVSDVGVSVEGSRAPIRLRYFGAAGWEITDGKTVVLVDPYISRLKYVGGGNPDDKRPAYARNAVAKSDTALIDKLITRADFILVHHSHFDHLGDVPYIAKKTGAKVIGTETTTSILRAYGIPREQLYTVGGGEDYQFENFSVRVIPSIHSALNKKLYYDSRRYDRNTELKAPLRINQFIEGGSLTFLARFDQRTVLTMGSMNFVERELEGIHPDILLAGVNGSRLGLYKYDERLLKVTGYPSVVIPTHWDNFQLPYGFSQEANRTRNLVPFIKTVRGVSPKTRVIPPTHLKTIVIE